MSIKTIDPQTLKSWIAEDKAVLVDVREAGEVARERIPAAHHMPLSQFDPSGLPKHDGKIIVYHCASGGRTAQFGAQLANVSQAANDVFHLAGGIMSWKMQGFETA
ncbi:MAG: rhodanese-like domain-containing protein [Rhodospirillaceae bacterium]|nr:rhodanese-like domain-containing protein [Rhodospirillaceae bacterium]